MRYGTATISISVILLLIICFPSWSAAQYQVQHTAPTVINPEDNSTLRFSVPGISRSDIQQAYLYYRTEGDVSYNQQQVDYRQGTFQTKLDINSDESSSVEYYFSLTTRDGNRTTYPEQNPSDQPVRVEVVDRESKDPDLKNKEGTLAAKIGYNILSPDPDKRVSREDLVIAATFFYEDTTIQKGSFQLHLDGQNVTSEAQTSSYFLSYVPERITRGSHRVKIVYERNGSRYKVAEWSFEIGTPDTETEALSFQQGQENFTSGEVQFSARDQQVAQSQDDILRGRLRMRGRQGDLRYSVTGNLTTQESSRLQPQNRFSAELRYQDWAELRAGDFYEQMSRMTLSGRRVRGVNAELHLNGDNINGMFVYGRMRRSVPNLYQAIQSSYDTVGTTGNQPIIDSTYSMSFQNQGRGAYQRKIVGGRISFGDRTPIRWGLNAIKVQDDTNSVDPVNDFLDVTSRPDRLTSQLTNEEIQYLQQNPGALSVTGTENPKGNFVTSTDLSLNLDQNRIRFDTEVGVSMLNNDINGGYLTQERADDLGLDLDHSTEDILSQLSWFIIVNENMSTLPFRYDQSGSGDSELQPFVPMGIFGGRSEARFYYFDHRLRVQYRWMGPDYRSLANSTIRRDLSGFNISDRFNLLQNQIFVTLGYERLQNNVLGTEDATTTTSTYRTNLSWYPVRSDLPRISAGIRLRDRGNGVERTNPFLSGDQLFASVRNVRTTGSDTVVAPRPVNAFTTQLNFSITQQFEVADILNDATFNVSYLKTDDQAFRYGGVESMSYSFQLQNRYTNLPLNTRIGFHLNQSESRGGLASFDIYGVSLGGTAFLLDDKLELSGRLAYTRNTQKSESLEVNQNKVTNVFDNYYTRSGTMQTEENNTYAVNFNARYQLATRHSLVALADFTNVVSRSANRSLPNDRILELRYIFEF